MTGDRKCRCADWLVLATLPGGERFIVVPTDGQAVDRERADDLASAVDLHSEVHAVGERVPVWRATGWHPEADGYERYDLPERRQFPILEDEPQAPDVSSPQVYFVVDGHPAVGSIEDYIVAQAWRSSTSSTFPRSSGRGTSR